LPRLLRPNFGIYPNLDWDSHHAILIQIGMVLHLSAVLTFVVLHIEVGCNTTDTDRLGHPYPNLD
jgi:hypothetical protein